MARVIVVTGGAGYIGSHTVAALLEQDAEGEVEIVVVDNLSNAYKCKGQSKPESLRRVEELTGRTITFYPTDIRDAAGLDGVFEKHKVYCVIHFAALKAVGESTERPLEYYQNNITGTCVLLEVMRNHGVHKLVYSSSCTVYGEPKKLPVDESIETGHGLTSPYGKTKYFCEEICKDFCDSVPGFQVISLRYFNPVGAHPSGRIGEHPTEEKPNNLMPYISQVAVGKLGELQVFGSDYPTCDGTGVRDYIHIMDLADGHVRAVTLFDKPEHGGFEAINLGTGTGYSVLQMIRAFEEASGKKIPYRVVARRPGDIAAIYADASRAKRVLGWTAARDLRAMCKDTWRWQSENPKGFEQTSRT